MSLSEDIIRVAEIEKEAFPAPWTGTEIKKLLESPFVRLHTEKRADRITGYCIYSLVLGEMEVLKIAVDKDFKRQGIAFNMLSGLIASKDVEAVFLEVRTQNLPAVALYEKLGFRRIGLRKGYYENGDDAIVYKLDKSERQVDL